MQNVYEIIEKIKKNKPELKNEYGVKEIGIFGSYVRGEQKDLSDLDILVELEKPLGFVKFLKLEKKFSNLLNLKVDIVTRNAFKPFIGEKILQEVKYV